MVDSRAAQAGIYGLAGTLPEARTAQAGIYALISTGVPVRASQAGLYGLIAITAEVRVAQAGIYMLAGGSPCSTKWAQIWTITRLDGEVFRFTSLDRDLDYGAHTYRSCDSLVPSASESVSEVDAAGSMDLSGAIGPDGITEVDLYAGLFDGATALAELVAWSGTSIKRRLLKGTFGAVEQSETGFKVEILGDGAKLQQTPLISLIQPGCRWQFGDSKCGVDLGPLTVTGTIDSASGQREFVDAARVEAAGYFSRGRITITSGANAGISREIKDHIAGGAISVWEGFPYALLPGATYSMTPGCTNIKVADGGTNGCAAWNNVLRYGGFDKVPGRDRSGAAANAR